MERLPVVLEGEVAGEITPDGDGMRFAYVGERSSSTPLSLSLPPRPEPYPDDRIRAWVRGLLPDGGATLQRWGTRVGLVGAATPERLLATPIGWDCAGAVQFCTPAALETMLQRSRHVAPASDGEIAAALRDAIADAAGQRSSGSGTAPCYSLAGGQPKIALALTAAGWQSPTGAAPSTHILKPPPSAAAGEQPVNEHLCLATARRLGLNAAESALAVFDAIPVVVVQRYDRAPGLAGPVRVHQEDAAQALGRPPDTRAEALQGVSTVHIADLLRSADAPHEDVWAVVDRLALAWALGLIDGHGKNTSLLLAENQVRLAPLYDIATMLPYTTRGEDIYLAMHVANEPTLALIGRDHWETHARRLQLPVGDVLQRVARIAAETAAAATEAAADCADHPAAGTLPARFADAAAAWRAHCLDALTTTPTARPQVPGRGLGITCLA